MDDVKNYYFIGAGGIGMAALERYMLSRSKNVAGYDRTPSQLTEALVAEGVKMTFGGEADEIPEGFRDPATTTVVYTPAVPESLPLFGWFRDNGFRIIKRAALLGKVTSMSRSLCFAGTHGKTTTSSMAAHILHSSSTGCSAFLGGVLRNYGTNFLLSDTSPYTVIEADEYDRSFHHLHPYIAVITATDPDHLDIYGTEQAYLESFAHFTELIQPGGNLVVHTGLKLQPKTPDGVGLYTYSRDCGNFHADRIRHEDGTIRFDFIHPKGVIKDLELGVPVEINIENAVAALAAVHLAGELDAVSARKALASFMGPKRRFEFHMREPGPDGRAVIDDYAHHPDELRASITSVRALYPSRHLTVAFQPHLYSRTRDFAPEFADALSLADSVVLLDIYPAREEPIPGVSSRLIFDAVTSADKVMISKEDLTETLKNRNFDILLTAGAGDIVDFVPEIVANATR